MERKKLPPLKITMPELVECPGCNGRRVLKPMFYEYACSQCNGLGKVQKENGDPVPVEIGYPALMASISHLRYVVSYYRTHMTQGTTNPYDGSGDYKGD